MPGYESDVQMGERYCDTQTGFEGTCTAVTFFQHGCERLTLKGINKLGNIVDYAFDAPEVTLMKDSTVPVVRKVGGPHDRTPMRR
jgi:hypothetical protein